jgi:outer membrane protein TolC
MNMQYRIFLYLASACTFCQPAYAIDLEQLWASVKAASPEVLISHQNQEIAHSEIQISLSKLLPSARYAYSYGDSTTERKNSGATAAQSQDYKLERKQFTISQPLFRMQEYFTLRQSLSNAKATDNETQQAVSDFFMKIATAYFETANALEQYTLGKQRADILNQLYIYAQKSLAHGTGTRSDVDDAKAKLDISLADQLERASALKNAERSLSALSGFDVKS